MVLLETIDPAIIERMTGAGFSCCRYDPLTRTLEAAPPGAGARRNTLFVRNLPATAARLTGAEPVEVLGQRI